MKVNVPNITPNTLINLLGCCVIAFGISTCDVNITEKADCNQQVIGRATAVHGDHCRQYHPNIDLQICAINSIGIPPDHHKQQ